MATIAHKVGPKFQVTIPKKIRDALGIKVGDLLDVVPLKDGILLHPVAVAQLSSKDGVARKRTPR